MRVVLVGVDGSVAAGAALGWATRLAVGAGAELILANAWAQVETKPTFREHLRAEAAEMLDRQCQAVAAAGVSSRALLVDGHPDALLAAADAEQADLLVVGTRGSGGFASLHLGSVAHHLSQHASLPLAIVPVAGAGRNVTKIVVGVDGSPGSAAAVAWSADLAAAVAASAVVVLAREPPIEAFPGADPNSWYQRAEGQLTSWTAPLIDVGVSVEQVIVESVHPVTAIADTAERQSGDLVVVGTHGQGGFTNMRLGAVARQLVHRLQLPVALVPPAEPSRR